MERVLSAVLLLLFTAQLQCTATLLPSSKLVSDCYHWPAEQFTPWNHAPIPDVLVINSGDSAVDFTLLNANNTGNYTLSTLLQTKPVLLHMGSYT